MKLTKNADPDKYGCNGYGIGLDARSQFSLPHSSSGKNVSIFGIKNSSSVHVDNNEKNMSVLGQGLTKWLDDIRITAEAKNSISFAESGVKSTLLWKQKVLICQCYKNISFQSERFRIETIFIIFR